VQDESNTVVDGTLTRYGTLQQSSDLGTVCFSPTVGSVPLDPDEVLNTERIVDAGAVLEAGSYCATQTESCPPAACASSPCLNGGDCYDLESGEYSCLCTFDYTGGNCETEIITMAGPDFTSTVNAGSPLADEGWTFIAVRVGDHFSADAVLDVSTERAMGDVSGVNFTVFARLGSYPTDDLHDLVTYSIAGIAEAEVHDARYPDPTYIVPAADEVSEACTALEVNTAVDGLTWEDVIALCSSIPLDLIGNSVEVDRAACEGVGSGNKCEYTPFAAGTNSSRAVDPTLPTTTTFIDYRAGFKPFTEVPAAEEGEEEDLWYIGIYTENATGVVFDLVPSDPRAPLFTPSSPPGTTTIFYVPAEVCMEVPTYP
jgi:hypothetical protein